MIRPRVLREAGRVGVMFTTLALAIGLAACGNNGTSTIAIGPPLPELKAKVTGVVWAPCLAGNESSPNCGTYALRAPRLKDQSWAASLWSKLSFVGTAYARLFNNAPVGSDILVTLSEVSEADAADGFIKDPIPIVTNSPTDADGIYSIVSDAIAHIDTCRLMVSVGNGRNGDLSRSFVFAENTDIDAASEAVVRVIMDRLRKAPSVQLCDFSPEGLKYITEKAIPAAYPAKGADVQEINNDAYLLVKCDCDVADAIDAVTQVPPIGPRDCRSVTCRHTVPE